MPSDIFMGNGDRRACSVRLALEHDVLKRVSPAAVVKFLQDEVECIKCVQTDKDGSLIVTFESVDYVEHILSLGTLTINGYPVVVTNVDARRKYVKVYYLPYEVSNREVHVALGEFGHVYHIRRDMMMNHPEIETGDRWMCFEIHHGFLPLGNHDTPIKFSMIMSLWQYVISKRQKPVKNFKTHPAVSKHERFSKQFRIRKT
ncbi:hypothetical protein QZH41_006677 [Actinostola sp. cb2023]|nr:hypothetical protein QZH41_006677 [Actinostola sp. cb2023]